MDDGEFFTILYFLFYAALHIKGTACPPLRVCRALFCV